MERLNRAVFVVDCLRYDAVPRWFDRHFGRRQRFETACNTPLYFNSLFAGRNLLGEYPFTRASMFKLYVKPPSQDHLLTKLERRGVACYWRSDAANVYNKTWWGRMMRSMPPEDEPWFLLWHDFGVHTHQGRVGGLRERRQRHREYLSNVDAALRRVAHAVKLYVPDRYVVMGDHGEEFYDGERGRMMYGHGTFDNPILTDNVRFTPAYVSNDAVVSTFPELYRWVLEDEVWLSPAKSRKSATLTASGQRTTK